MNQLIKNTINPVSNQPNKLAFQNPELSYTVTSRDILPSLGISEYLQMLFPFIKPSQVTSLFGFTYDFSPLFGGRQFNQKHTLTRHHLEEMETLGIHLSMNMTNHFFSEEAYQASMPLLEKHHKNGNLITCLNDTLAERIRKDFPNYSLKASIIKNLNTLSKVEHALQLYDDVVIPMDKNDDTEFLAALPEKQRIILFANASCAYNCPSRSCYVGFSQENQGKNITSECSIPRLEREPLGKVFFDVNGFYDLGFRKMKLIPPFTPPKKKALTNAFQDHKTWHIYQRAKQKNELIYIVSYPKTGRTWLRYFLTYYTARLKNIDMDVNLASMFNLFPNDTEDTEKGRIAFNTLLRKDIPLIQFSHATYSGVFSNSKTLQILRSIPDTLVSEYFHFTQHLSNDNALITDYLFQDKQGINRLCHYLNSWAKQPQSKDTLTISYESMHRQPTLLFTKVLNFLQIECREDMLKEAIEQANFDNMASQEKRKTIPGHTYDYKNTEARRIRKGEINNYPRYLDEATFRKINKICTETLTETAKQRLADHNLWPITETKENV